jgi:predicted DCC family thiol-disulfide oxidoreductase YuxK
VNTEKNEMIAGWVLYDGECAICTRWVARFYHPLRRRGFRLAPLQTPGIAERFGLKEEGLLNEMRLVTRDGHILGGADALAEIARALWWTWPVWLAYQLPGAKPVLRAAYRWLARNRYCLGGACRIGMDGKHTGTDHRVTSSFFEIP